MKTIYQPSASVRPSVFASSLVLAFSLLSGVTVAEAGRASTAMCQDLEKGMRGLCRAAIRSGCGEDGRNQDSIHCAKLESKYRHMSDGDNPVWLAEQSLPTEED